MQRRACALLSCVVLATAIAACGRIRYAPDVGGPEAGTDAGAALDAGAGHDASDGGEGHDAGGPGDGGANDAGAPPMPGEVVKLTTAAPLFTSPLPTSGDCGEFAMFFVNDQPIDNNAVIPSVFLDPDGHTLWLSLPCKHVDTGWNLTLGRWDTAGGDFEQLDPDAATPAREAFVRIDDTYSDGSQVGSTRGHAFALAADGSLVGAGAAFDGTIHHVVPIFASSPAMLSAASYVVAERGVLDPPASTPWAVRTAYRRNILRVGSTYYVYSAHWDGSSMTPLGLESTSIAVSTSTDLRSVTFGGSPVLADGWAQPYVSESGGTFHMVARRLDTNSWHHVRGTSPTDFDFAGATPLGLARHAGGPGAWDELRYTSHGLSGDPQVVGAVAVGDTLFVLYVAGVPPHGSFAGNARARGSLGVFAVVIAP